MNTPTPAHCPNCGAQLQADAVFCHRCGRNFTVEMATQQIPANQMPGSGTEGFHQPTDPATSGTFTRLRTSLSDRYDLVRELGRGGMATVFLAKDLKHDRDVAIKVLHPELAASLGAERFEREIKLAAKLQHPHILGLYDSGAVEGLLYYVMPFVKGEALRDRLDREGMLPVDDAIRIALEVCDALGHAHGQGIVHRDIKPENILLSGDHALVADFGIARAVSEAGTQKLTQTGMAVGTPVYMAPEQASGDTVGPTADLYSLGCVLYEMLAGSPPFHGTTPMAIMAQHLMEQPPSVTIVRSAVPVEVEDAIFAVLGKVPADRPQTAAQFAELMGLLPGSTAHMRVMRPTPSGRRTMSGARPMMAVPEPVVWWRRPATVAIATLILAAGTAGAFWRWSTAARSAVDAGPEARRLAILYFADRSRDHSLGPLADGLTEGLIRALSNASSLTVISQSGVERFRGSSAPPDSVAKVLRAGYLVRGEVEPEGERITVSLRLDDRSGIALKRASFARPAGNLLAMRDTLSVVASDLIRQQLGEELRVRESATTSDAGAWLLVQRGRQAQRNAEESVAKGDSVGTEREFHAADSLFALAEKTDARWAEPITLRAGLAYRRSRLVGRDPARIRPWVTVGLAHAERALAVDMRSADALELRGNLRYWSWFANLEPDAAKKDALLLAAKADLDSATSVNPRQAGAWASLASLYYQLPKATTSEALLAATKAYDNDEFAVNVNATLNRLFLASYDLASFDKARQWCREFGLRFPGDVRSSRCRLYLLSAPDQASVDVDEAWRIADSVVTLTAPATQPLERLTANMLVAAVLARASKSRPALADSARHVAKAAEGNAQVDGTRQSAYQGAFVYTILGDRPEAIRLLGAYLAANPQRASSLRDDPGWWFRDLERDPQFRRLVGGGD